MSKCSTRPLIALDHQCPRPALGVELPLIIVIWPPLDHLDDVVDQKKRRSNFILKSWKTREILGSLAETHHVLPQQLA